MNKNHRADDGFTVRLKQNLRDPRAEQVPESLRPENVGRLLTEKAPDASDGKKITRFPIRQVAAAAAVVVVLAAALVIRPKFRLTDLTASAETGSPLPDAPDAPSQNIGGGTLPAPDTTVDPDDYSVVEQALRGLNVSGNGVRYETSIEETKGMPGAAQQEIALVSEAAEVEDDYSLTNVQVQGVDEADILKSDGRYLYLVTNRNDFYYDGEKACNRPRLQIVSTAADGQMDTVWSYEPEEGIISELFLEDGKLTVLMTVVGFGEVRTRAEIYDVADPTRPTLLRAFEQDGAYSDARLINGRLLLVSRKYVYDRLPTDGVKFDPEAVIPKTFDSLTHGEPEILPADALCCMPDPASAQFTTVSLIAVDGETPAQSLSLLGGNTLYVNQENAYLAESVPDQQVWGSTRTVPEIAAESGQDTSVSSAAAWYFNTEIARINIASGTPVLTGTAAVPGTLCSQFAMDEYDGCLRVATNSDRCTEQNGYEQCNNLYVLNADMEIIGRLEGLAPQENMHAVRFEGETAYAVTYRTCDPFFVIDLSDPENPTVTGALELPGYSDYLHPYDGSLVLGFGIDTLESEDKTTAYTQGFKIAVFDVSDPSNPVEKHSVYLGGRGSTSSVLYDHKALLFDRSRSLIGIPVTLYRSESGEPLAYGGPEFNGYILFTYSPETGFTELGRVSHADAEADFYGSTVERGAYIANVLFTLSDRTLVSTDMTTFEELDREEYARPESEQPVAEGYAGDAGTPTVVEVMPAVPPQEIVR